MNIGRVASLLLISFGWISACSDDDVPGGGGAGTSGASGTGGASGGAGGSSAGAAGASGGTGGSSAGAGGVSGGAGGTPDAGGSQDGDATGDSNAGDAACGGPIPTTVVDAHCTTPDGGRGDNVPPHEGSEADDDNCLYHAKITVPCIQQNRDVTFTLDLKNIGTTTPATMATPEIEPILPPNHPAPNTNPMATENNGVYTIGPVRFDRAGKWTVAFHIYDAAPAKHSHFSFFVQVP